MADTIITKKVTDLTENTAVSDEDLFLVGNAGTAALRKVKWSNIFSKINELIKAKVLEWTFENLGTTDKTLVGAVNELNTKLYKITDIKSTGDSGATIGNVVAKEIVFTLESHPTECRFVPVVCRWCSVEKCTITISSNTVTVSMNIECLYSTTVMAVNGFLIYK